MPKKVPKHDDLEFIQFVGINGLEPEEKDIIEDISAEHYDKIKRKISGLEKLVVHLKIYTTGGRKKYSFHIRTIAPTKTFESCKAHDWDLARAIRKSFEDIIHQIEHAFKSDKTRKTRSGMPLKGKGRFIQRRGL